MVPANWWLFEAEVSMRGMLVGAGAALGARAAILFAPMLTRGCLLSTDNGRGAREGLRMPVKTSLLKAGVLMLLLAAAMPALAQQIFSILTERSGTVPVDKSSTVVRAITVLIDPGQLSVENRRLRLIIFDNETLGNLTAPPF